MRVGNGELIFFSFFVGGYGGLILWRLRDCEDRVNVLFMFVFLLWIGFFVYFVKGCYKNGGYYRVRGSL